MKMLRTTLALATLAATFCIAPATSSAQVDIHVKILPPGWVEPAPPRDLDREFARKGFHDGVNAARYDVDHRLPLDVRSHREFDRPPAPPDLRDDYRRGFQRGYREVVSHLIEQPAPRPQPAPRGDQWRTMPQSNYNDSMRRGYQDGAFKAREDLDHRRSYNLNRHDLFKSPPVPRFQRDDYRLGFQRGYDDTFNHDTRDDHARRDDRDDRWAPDAPREFHNAGRDGFRAGLEAARHDWFDRKDPNASRHDEYRRPPYFGRDAEEYRIGFQRGYDQAFDHWRNRR